MPSISDVYTVIDVLIDSGIALKLCLIILFVALIAYKHEKSK